MKHTPQGTFIEPGDPHYINFIMGNCPVCGAELYFPERLATSGGHLRACLGGKIGTVTFAACSEHYEEAQKVPTKHEHKESLGYLGQWEPRFGLIAEIHYSGKPTKLVRLV
jgi:hypothetical protein